MGKYNLTGNTYIRASQAVARILYELGSPAGAADAESDARLICEHAFSMERSRFILSDHTATPAQAEAIEEIIDRRIAGEPLQYILGEAWFMGHSFAVRPGVLIPRRDSEVLAVAAIERAPRNAAVLDMCCGSGCLGIALALARPDISLTLADISPDAIDIAAQNANRHGVKAELVQTDLFAALPARFDMILCNPPYIPSADIAELDAEVALHEPRLALDGGSDGLGFYRRLFSGAVGHLAEGGIIMVEHGINQQGDIAQMLDKYGYNGHDILFDMEGRARVAYARAVEVRDDRRFKGPHKPV